MIPTRRTLLAALTTVLATTAVACGASAPAPADYGSPGSAAKSASSDNSAPGYGQPLAMEADSAGGPAAPAAVSPAQPSPPPGARADAPAKQQRRETAPEPSDRPGLGTQWGESRDSRITTVPFVRADQGTPFASASVYYNDAEGANAMASSSGFRRTGAGAFTVANGSISLGLRDEHRSFLSGFITGDRSYVIGEAGRRYTIVIKNRTNARFECIISVDGLDVLDGKAASFSKRGYLVDPGSELEVDGFRQSTEQVAAFRFGSVRGSYANQKHGETRNVGVIGVALFHERGSNPVPWSPEEVNRRHDANPFPGQFATPPGSK
jgi:hypothetical protein